MDQRPKYKPETITYIEENIGTKLMDLDLRDFMNLIIKTREVKETINELDYIKLKGFYSAKETVNKTKKATKQMGDGICKQQLQQELTQLNT